MPDLSMAQIWSAGDPNAAAQGGRQYDSIAGWIVPLRLDFTG
jgi:hypothetical protein